MKFVKGVALFLVLCLVAYGAVALLKKPSTPHVSESEIKYLQDMGINVQGDGQAAESGLSSVLSDVEGVAPIGSVTGSTSSSMPPSFLGGSVAAPPFAEPAPRLASATSELQAAPEFFAPAVDVLPPPDFAEPPVQFPPVEAPLFETPPIPTTESPPPWEESWDGPVSDLSATLPPTDFLQPLPSPLYITPSAPALAHVQSLPVEETALPSTEGSIRRIELDSTQRREDTFSTADSVPVTPVQYTRTSARKPLTFEPVKQEALPNTNTPVVAFAPPKRTNTNLPPQQQPGRTQLPEQPLVASSAVRQIGTPRTFENSLNPLPDAQPAVQESVERFIQSQRHSAESGEPEKVRLAFIQLSQLYEHNQLGEAERAMMQPLLDMLALKVIYAKDTHILESPYRVKPGETVASIAKEFSLPPALLRKINGLTSPQEPAAGAVLKVMHGQFDARISVKRKELTLLLGGLYAGRFPFRLSLAGTPMRSGDFFVTHKTDRTIALNNGWILATAHTKDATIVFADQDAREIFDILSEQSVIVVE